METFKPEEYQKRRLALLSLMPLGSTACFPAADNKVRNGTANHYLYRQASDVLYLSGFNEDESTLVLHKDRAGKCQTLLFAKEANAKEDQWNGARMGLDAARKLGFNRVHESRQLKRVLNRLLKETDRIFISSGANLDAEESLIATAAAKGLQSTQIHCTSRLTGPLRLVKSPDEQKVMERSASIGTHAHNAAMLQCHPGMTENQLRACLEYIFVMNGASAPAYSVIVAGGENAYVLHHPADDTILADGDLVLVDAGCEYLGYASDITRTYPVNGVFSPAQKEIYELVLAAQKAAIAAVKPGITWSELEAVVEDILTKGLKKLGFRGQKAGDYMPHTLGHWLGMDVHDVGSYETGKGKAKAERALQPGMVITIEPGLYISKSDERAPAKYRGISVRIEDDLLVTADGATVLTQSAFKEPADIEEMMKVGKGMREELGDGQLVVPPRIRDC